MNMQTALTLRFQGGMIMSLNTIADHLIMACTTMYENMGSLLRVHWNKFMIQCSATEEFEYLFPLR